jgi:outer membrane protein OmpA-like peptidoglycan-associated protein
VGFFLLIAASSSLFAQQGSSWVELQGSFMVPHSSSLKNGGAYGLGGGTWLSDRWGLELSALSWKLKSDRGLGLADATETSAFLSGLFNLYPGNRSLTPYAFVGVGGSHVEAPWSYKADATTVLNLSAGLGLQAPLGDHFIFSLEGRGAWVDVTHPHYEGIATVGLGLRWGGAPAAAAPAPPPAVAQAPEPLPPPPPPPPAPEPVPPPPPPPPPVVNPEPAPAPPTRIVLDQAVLHFANGGSGLDAEAVRAIQTVAEKLKAFPGEYSLQVSGHTSSSGSARFNRVLSKRRADSVARVLVDAGIPAGAVTTVGVGPDRPIADNRTADGQARNRRVEIEIKVKGAQVETDTIDTAVNDTQAAPAKPK